MTSILSVGDVTLCLRKKGIGLFQLGRNEKHVVGYIESLEALGFHSDLSRAGLVQGLTQILETAGEFTAKPMSFERFDSLRTLLMDASVLFHLPGHRNAITGQAQLTVKSYALANCLISASERIDLAGWLYASAALGDLIDSEPALGEGIESMATYVYRADQSRAAAQDLPASMLRNGGHVPNASLTDYSMVQRVEIALFKAGINKLVQHLGSKEAVSEPLMTQVSLLKIA